MPGFQRKYAIEIDINVMGSEERHRNWTEEWRPGQRGRAQLLTTFGRLYEYVMWSSEDRYVTETSAVWCQAGCSDPYGNMSVSRTCFDQGYWLQRGRGGIREERVHQRGQEGWARGGGQEGSVHGGGQVGSVYGGGQGGEEGPVQSHACDALYLSSNILLVTVIVWVKWRTKSFVMRKEDISIKWYKQMCVCMWCMRTAKSFESWSIRCKLEKMCDRLFHNYFHFDACGI